MMRVLACNRIYSPQLPPSPARVLRSHIGKPHHLRARQRAPHRSTIAQLRDDNSQLLKDLVADTRRLRRARTSSVSATTDSVQREIERLMHRVQHERSAVEISSTPQGRGQRRA